MMDVTLRFSLRFQPSKLKFCPVVSVKTVESSTILLDTIYCLYIASQTKILIISNGKIKPAAAPKSPQSCPTLCDPIDGSP